MAELTTLQQATWSFSNNEPPLDGSSQSDELVSTKYPVNLPTALPNKSPGEGDEGRDERLCEGSNDNAVTTIAEPSHSYGETLLSTGHSVEAAGGAAESIHSSLSLSESTQPIQQLQDVPENKSIDFISETGPLWSQSDHEVSTPKTQYDNDELESILGSIHDTDYEPFKRDLRPQYRNSGISLTTWLDKDDTGDYDPAEEQRLLKRKRRRVPRHAKLDTSRNSPHRPKPRNPDTGTDPADITALRFRTVSKKLEFAKLASGLELVDESCDGDFTSGRRLRTTHAREQHLSVADGEHTVPDDLTGHPKQRGCYACSELEEKCSLLDDEREWPCRSCQETGKDDCDLIVPPVRKLACQFCKRQRIACSFTLTRNQGESCRACTQRGFRCVAGPVKEFIKPRVRYERDWIADPLLRKKSPREPGPCLECHGSGSECSFAQENDGHSPCAECEKRGLPCTLGASQCTAAPVPVAESAVRQNPDQQPHSNIHTLSAHGEPIPEIPAFCLDSSAATVITSFAHPVVFNADTAEPDSSVHVQECHFCSEPILAITGLGRRRVSVLDTHNGSGWVETSGGHRAAGDIAGTSLCTACTTHRLQIVMCESHVMNERAHATQQGDEKAVEPLFAEHAVDLCRYCNLCHNFAMYECKEKEGGHEQSTGCGLRLCEPCMLLLMGRHDGRLSDMLAHIDLGPREGRPFGFRADCEFLRPDGALMKWVDWMSRS